MKGAIGPTRSRIEPTDQRGEDFQVILDLLRGIDDRLRRIEARLAPRQNPDDLEILSRLLPAIGGKVGSETFTARDVLQDPALQLLAGGITCQKLGKLFARFVGLDIGGLRLDKSGLENNAQLWFITRIVSIG